jgi:hypothetical protein
MCGRWIDGRWISIKFAQKRMWTGISQVLPVHPTSDLGVLPGELIEPLLRWLTTEGLGEPLGDERALAVGGDAVEIAIQRGGGRKHGREELAVPRV